MNKYEQVMNKTWTRSKQFRNKSWTSFEQVIHNCGQLLKFLTFLCGWVGGPNFAGVKAGDELGKKGKNHENISHWCHYKLIAYMNTDCNMSPLIPIWQQNNIQTIWSSLPYSNQFYQFYFIMLLHWWVWLRKIKFFVSSYSKFHLVGLVLIICVGS